MMGICVIVSGAMLYPIPCIQRWRLSHGNQDDAEVGPRANQEEQVALSAIPA